VKLVAYLSAAFGFREPETGDLLRVEAKHIAGYLDLLFDLGAAVVTLSDLRCCGSRNTRGNTGYPEPQKGKDIDKIGYHPTMCRSKASEQHGGL
jgi:hypothetical protein